MSILHTLFLIFVVILIFNVFIFVHELGHFLAAKWRGLVVERFQIWFGKPLWKKEVDGVQYGLGWIPAGGFVALPQMAPMEAIEGENHSGEELPPVKPLDKIIVAFAGPLFSFLLAVFASLIVWGVGKPLDRVETTQVGYVLPDSSAQKAGILAGDQVVAINDQPVKYFGGGVDGLYELVALSRGEKIKVTLKRDGVEGLINLESGYKIPDSQWYHRKRLREIGVVSKQTLVVEGLTKGSPAELAGFQEGDYFLEANGEKLLGVPHLSEILKANKGSEVSIKIQREGKTLIKKALASVPSDSVTGEPYGKGNPMLGVAFDDRVNINELIYHPTPVQQVNESVKAMWYTITALIAKNSSVSVEHLSGPIGIGGGMLDLLKTEHGWRRIIWFAVLININLAIVNMLPFPVLDGGHILISSFEWLMRRPVHVRLLEAVQTSFVMLIFGLFLFITFKDVGDRVRGKPKKSEPVWSRSVNS